MFSLFSRPFIFIFLICTLSSITTLAQDNTIYEKSFELTKMNDGKFQDVFKTQEPIDDFYISVQTSKAGCGLADVRINGRRVQSIAGLVRFKKYLQKVELESSNTISVSIKGRVGTLLSVKIFRLSAFQAIVDSVGFRSSNISQKINFEARDPASDHILKIEFTDIRYSSFFSVKLNGKIILNPIDFILNNRRQMIFKLIDVSDVNEISVNYYGDSSRSNLRLTIYEPASKDVVMSNVTSLGGTLELPGVATISIPVGAFEASSKVALAKSATLETANDYAFDSKVMGIKSRSEFEVRINTGLQQPKTNIKLVIKASDEFAQQISQLSELAVIAQIDREDELDATDNFDVIPISDVDVNNKLVFVDLGPEAFSSNRREDGTFEAIVMLVRIPEFNFEEEFPELAMSSLSKANIVQEIAQSRLSLAASFVYEDADRACEYPPLGVPFDGSLLVNRGVNKIHQGVDYNAVEGTEIKALASGKVLLADYRFKKKAKNPVKGIAGRGWGNFILILHLNGTATLYAHIRDKKVVNDKHFGDFDVKEGDSVVQGDIIARSGATGGAKGAHLHVEYTNEYGNDINHSPKVSAEFCVGLSRLKSLVIYDSGIRKDDTVSVKINGLPIATMVLGVTKFYEFSRAFAPGRYKVDVECLSAPDEICSFGVAYGEGLNKGGAGGINYGSISVGGSASTIVVVDP